MADMQNPNLWDKFSNKIDPLTLGLSLLQTNNGQNSGISNLGTALIAGRQTRIQQAQEAAAASAAAVKQRQETQAKQGEINKDLTTKGFKNIQFPTSPDANPYIPTATYDRRLDPAAQNSNSAEFGVNAPVFINPKTGSYATLRQDKAGNQFLQDTAGNRVTDTTGFLLASQDPAAAQAVAAAKAAGGVQGTTQATAEQALPQAKDAADQYKGLIKDYMSYYPVTDIKTGVAIDPTTTQYNPATMRAGETNRMSSGLTAKLPPITDTGREIYVLRKQIQSREFIDGLLGAKAQGATFGSLTEGEGTKIEGYRTVIADPDATPRQRASAAYNLFQEIDKAAARLNAKANMGKPNMSTTTKQQPTVVNW